MALVIPHISRNRLLLVVSICVLGATASAGSAETCKEPMLESVSSDHPECHYYKGTRHYRANQYSTALQEWQAVVDKKDMPEDFEYLRAHAQNNLGYLYYLGLGVQPNLQRAIKEYWLPAEKSGHAEATYHLCHVYADNNSSRALRYCREALSRYQRDGKADGENSEVVAELRRYIASLEIQLTETSRTQWSSSPSNPW